MSHTVASLDVPQQDDLGKVRSLVSAIKDETPLTELSSVTGISPRHVQYTLHAARVLGLIMRLGESWMATKAGLELLTQSAGSAREREWLRRTIGRNTLILTLAPNLFATPAPELEAVTERLQKLAGLSLSTAARRALTLLSWREALVVEDPNAQMGLF